MNNISLHVLLLLLACFIVLSAFFSGSETAMMSLNRYRLRHLVRNKHQAATRAAKLLQRIDNLLGVILIGNTFANILASAVATVIAVRLFGEVGVLFASITLTFVVLIFAEIIPKTLAATYAEKFAFFVALPLKWCLKILYPIVWIVNLFVKFIFWLLRIKRKTHIADALSYDELRTVLHEATGGITPDHQEMLLSVLSLEKVVVEDVMVPRREMSGIDINDSWEVIKRQIVASGHSKLLLYRDSVDQIIGFLSVREIMPLLVEGKLTKTGVLKLVREPYFVPESTPLMVQLLQFKRHGQRIALVVDEYGGVEGLISLEDILEEIVGGFTTELTQASAVMKQPDGSYLVAGNVHLRDLNRSLGLDLPIGRRKTLNGLIMEHLEAMPKVGVRLHIAGCAIRVLQVKQKKVWVAKIIL